MKKKRFEFDVYDSIEGRMRVQWFQLPVRYMIVIAQSRKEAVEKAKRRIRKSQFIRW